MGFYNLIVLQPTIVKEKLWIEEGGGSWKTISFEKKVKILYLINIKSLHATLTGF